MTLRSQSGPHVFLIHAGATAESASSHSGQCSRWQTRRYPVRAAHPRQSRTPPNVLVHRPSGNCGTIAVVRYSPPREVVAVLSQEANHVRQLRSTMERCSRSGDQSALPRPAPRVRSPRPQTGSSLIEARDLLGHANISQTLSAKPRRTCNRSQRRSGWPLSGRKNTSASLPKHIAANQQTIPARKLNVTIWDSPLQQNRLKW